jgi:hypothetical protein
MLLEDDPAQAKSLLDDEFSTGQDLPRTGSSRSTSRRESSSQSPRDLCRAVVSRDAIGVSLAELRQDEEDLEGAIDVV